MTSSYRRTRIEHQPESPTLAKALVAAGRGFWVFPAAPFGKTPHDLIRSWADAATNDPDEIRERSWPKGANIAIACKPSGLLVVDPDRHARDGVKAWTRLCEEHEADGDWPDTYTVRTPTGGYHLYFANPDPERYGNSSGSLPEGIDIRGGGTGDGGYVLGAGSVMDRRAYKDPELRQLVGDGRAYVVDNDAPVLPAPGWLVGYLERAARPPSTGIAGNTDTAGMWFTAKLTDVQLEDHLEQTINRLTTETEGKRNSLLYWAAKRFGRAIALGRYDCQVARDLLKDAGRELDLSTDEIKSTIKSGFKKVGAL